MFNTCEMAVNSFLIRVYILSVVRARRLIVPIFTILRKSQGRGCEGRFMIRTKVHENVI